MLSNNNVRIRRLRRGRMRLSSWRAMIVCCGLLLLGARAQEPSVVLPQGRLVGVRVFPESSPVPIDTYLGVPYAAPPIGRLRFSAPARHRGWNRTLYAQVFGPRCPQSVHPDIAQLLPPKLLNEDCLFLNIWVPQSARQVGNLPVIVFLHSESFSTDAPIDLPGQDIAAEGVVFVSVGYRLNAFGFFTLAAADARGNMGLLDQYMALIWVKENIASFGGDPGAITLMGHSAGATSALYHMASPRTEGLFVRAIVMSPSSLEQIIEEQPSLGFDSVQLSRRLAARLGCSTDRESMASAAEVVRCMQTKPADDIIGAYQVECQLQNSNSSSSRDGAGGQWRGREPGLRPEPDTFLLASKRYLPRSPAAALREGSFRKVPLLFGLTDREAANTDESWVEVAREGLTAVLQLAARTLAPALLGLHGLGDVEATNQRQLVDVIMWEYFSSSLAGSDSGWVALQQVERLVSEARDSSAAARLAARLAGDRERDQQRTLYVYEYAQPGGVDLYARTLNNTGAAHGTELPLLLGPTLLQQLARRRLLPHEERLARRLRHIFTDFAKFGVPVSTRNRESWPPFSLGRDGREGHIQRVGGAPGERAAAERALQFWRRLLPRLANDSDGASARNSAGQQLAINQGNIVTLRGALYALLSLVVALVVLLLVCVALLRRAARRRDQRHADVS